MKAEIAPPMVHKNLPVSGVKVLDEESGIVEAFVSGIGNKDSVGDIIQPGAFVRSLGQRNPKGVWAHDWTRPVSKTLEAYEVPKGDARLPEKMQLAGIGGLYVKSQFNLKTEDGRYAFENVKFYDDESEWSIGYNVVDSEYDKKQKALLLKDIELFEYSPVLFGANPLTATVSLKVGGTEFSLSGSSDNAEEVERLAEAIKTALSSSEEDVEVQAVDEKTDAVSQDEEKTEVEEVEEVEDVEVKDESEVEEDEDEVDDEDDEDEDEESDDEEEVEDEKSETSDEVKALTDEEKAEIHEKALVGSLEELRQELSEAVRAEFGGPDTYVYVYATFTDSVIFEEYDYRAGTQAFYQTSFEKDGDSFDFSDPVEVDVVEVVVAKNYILDAITKGYGEKIKTILAPLSEKAAETAPFFDVEVAKALLGIKDQKAGRTLSKATASKISEAIEILSAVVESASTSDEEKEIPEVEEKTETVDETAEVKETEENVEEEKSEDAVDGTASIQADLDFLKELEASFE